MVGCYRKFERLLIAHPLASPLHLFLVLLPCALCQSPLLCSLLVSLDLSLTDRLCCSVSASPILPTLHHTQGSGQEAHCGQRIFNPLIVVSFPSVPSCPLAHLSRFPPARPFHPPISLVCLTGPSCLRACPSRHLSHLSLVHVSPTCLSCLPVSPNRLAQSSFGLVVSELSLTLASLARLSRPIVLPACYARPSRLPVLPILPACLACLTCLSRPLSRPPLLPILIVCLAHPSWSILSARRPPCLAYVCSPARSFLLVLIPASLLRTLSG